MKLTIGNYQVISDGSCVTLSQKRTYGPKSKKAGQEYFKEIGYYANLFDALARLINEQIAEADVVDCAELMLSIDEAKEKILDALAGIEAAK